MTSRPGSPSTVNETNDGRGGLGVTTGYLGAGIFGFEANVG